MNFTSEPFSDPDPPPIPRYRRRKKFFPSFDDSTRSKLVENLANRVSPNFDFFLFAVLSGAVTGLAFLFNSYPLLTLSALLAPIMSPVIGLSLAVSIGSVLFFFLSFAGTFVGMLLVFVVGVIAGIASFLLPEGLNQSSLNFTYASWDVLFILILGVFLTTLSLVKSEQKPVLPSAAVAYVFFSTAGSIGFNLGKGNFSTALDGSLTLFFFFLAAAILGSAIFFTFGFRPRSIPGYTMLFSMILLTGLITYTNQPFSNGLFFQAWSSKSTTSTLITATSSSVTASPIPSIKNESTPESTITPTSSLTPTQTATPTITSTPTVTLTPGPTPVWIHVNVDGQSGARLRENPGFGSKVIRIIDNGILVKLLTGVELKDKVYWAHVETIDGTIGWMVYTVLATSSPSASYTPTLQ